MQAELKAQGDEEAMPMDYDYISAMEYGMPPISGWEWELIELFNY